jgi:hypothetical protein
VVALCRRCRRAYDRGELDLLPHLEPVWRAGRARRVARQAGALRRISGGRTAAGIGEW